MRRVYETSELLLLFVLLFSLLHLSSSSATSFDKMHYSSAIALSLAASAAAFPGMNRDAMLEDLMKGKRAATPTTTAKASSTGLLGGVASVLGTVTGDLEQVVQGLVGSVASAVSADDFRPQSGYVFQAPGKSSHSHADVNQLG